MVIRDTSQFIAGIKSVAYIMAANFNKIYSLIFNYLENDPVRKTNRKSIIVFKIPFEPVSPKSFIKHVFLKNSKTFSQVFFLLFRKSPQIFQPTLLEGRVECDCVGFHVGYMKAIRSSTETVFVLPAARFLSASSRRIRNACRLTVR